MRPVGEQWRTIVRTTVRSRLGAAPGQAQALQIHMNPDASLRNIEMHPVSQRATTTELRMVVP